MFKDESQVCYFEGCLSATKAASTIFNDLKITVDESEIIKELGRGVPEVGKKNKLDFDSLRGLKYPSPEYTRQANALARPL